ncbi:lipocalin family protein [Acidisoma sp. 7E03]
MTGRLPAATPGVRLARLSVTTLALLVAGLGVIKAIPKTGRPPVPRRTVDLDRYLGLWHEFARYENRFERGLEAVTAKYSPRPDGLIRIVNTGRQGGVAGRLRWAEARGRVVPGTGNAKLRVSFFGPFFWGNYWVLDHAEDYSWSIVGEGSRRFLWILTREPHPTPERQALLIARVQALGYAPDRLHRTQHPRV